ncbi:hypothetical protein [Streptomyces sp. NPDC059411]|uniref:hypothetical protein n=1 Tax=Streptomyces sp. NPDC059411 TaxID=3346825 RepID=UPI00368527E2
MTEHVIDLATGIYEREAREQELYEYESAQLAETELPEEHAAPKTAPVGYLVSDPPAAARPLEPRGDTYRRLMQPR